MIWTERAESSDYAISSTSPSSTRRHTSLKTPLGFTLVKRLPTTTKQKSRVAISDLTNVFPVTLAPKRQPREQTFRPKGRSVPLNVSDIEPPWPRSTPPTRLMDTACVATFHLFTGARLMDTACVATFHLFTGATTKKSKTIPETTHARLMDTAYVATFHLFTGA